MTDLFNPRRWQGRFVRDYQTKGKKNYLLEACTAAGKTGGAIYAYVSLKISFGWDFFIGVVPSDTLMKQYAQDAQNLFGLKFYYSGTDKRLGRIPTLNELISKGYDGLIVSYQWLSYGENARTLKQSIETSSANKIFLVLDEVHHVSDELSYGQACEIAFPDEIISHRLMTSGTPFRSDGKRILGGWIDYQYDETKNQYIYKPNFFYKLVNALDDEIIPHFSFVTLAGEFSYRQGEAVYDGMTFDSENEEELSKILNTAIFVDGDWVKTAIEWAYDRMKRDLEQKSEDRINESSSSESSSNPTSSPFQPISSTGEFDSHIVDGKEISNEYTTVAEWAIVNHLLGQGWGKTPAHLADVFQQTPALFEVIRAEFDSQVANKGQTIKTLQEDIPPGFSRKYGTWLADKKTKYASQQAHKKAKRLAYLLLPKNINTAEIDMGKQISKIHVIAKQQNGIKQKGFIDYQDHEKIYLWLCDKVAQAELKQIRTTEDL